MSFIICLFVFLLATSEAKAGTVNSFGSFEKPTDRYKAKVVNGQKEILCGHIFTEFCVHTISTVEDLRSKVHISSDDDGDGVGIIIAVTVVVLLILIPIVIACVWFGTKKYDQLQEERSGFNSLKYIIHCHPKETKLYAISYNTNKSPPPLPSQF